MPHSHDNLYWNNNKHALSRLLTRDRLHGACIELDLVRRVSVDTVAENDVLTEAKSKRVRIPH